MAQADDVFDAVRRSCEEAIAGAEDVCVDDAGARALAQRLASDDLIARIATASNPVVFGDTDTGTKIDVAFEDVDAQVDYLCVCDLLQVGSGFRKPLHAHCGRGASDTMCLGVAALHRSSPRGRVDAALMSSVAADTQALARLFGIPAPCPDLEPLLAIIARLLATSADVLAARKCVDFAAFVRSVSPRTAGALVASLAREFPGFDDRGSLRGREVVMLKKAQLLACDLHRTVGPRDAAFAFADAPRMTAYVDNVLPAVLRHFGALRLSERAAQAVDGQEDLQGGSGLEVELRAAALVACERVLAAVHASGGQLAGVLAGMTMMDLDWYLWTVGKRPGIRQVERHVCRNTIYY
eukprot:m51a1_g13163 hypothetical protein (353) ;mRNA; r:62543-64032